MSFLTPLSLFTGPYGVIAKWGVIAALCAAVSGFFWVQGDRHGTRKLIDYQAKQAVETVRVAQARSIVTERVVTKYVQVKASNKTVSDTIAKGVSDYASSNSGSTLTPAWRMFHDAAALNTIPAAGFEPDGTSGATSAATALETVTENYAACTRNAQRLDALQGWIRAQAAVK